MPFRTEHAARVEDPGRFVDSTFRRETRRVAFGERRRPVTVILARRRGEQGLSVQAYRFPVRSWTADEARAWARRHDAMKFEPARGTGEPAAAALSLTPGDFAADGEQTTNSAGQPVQRFTKTIIRDGTYRHPSKGWTLRVTPERREAWVKAFTAMRENGTRVAVPDLHRFDAASNRGWVVDMRTVDDAIEATIELIGEDSIAAAGRNDVSVFIEPDVADGSHTYGEAISHVALTPAPVIPNLGDFRVAAARHGLREAEPLCYASSLTDHPEGDRAMADHVDRIADILGDDGVTADNWEERLQKAIKGRGGGSDGDRTASGPTVADVVAGRVAPSAELVEAVGKVADDKRQAAAKVDPDAIEDAAEATADRLAGLRDSGKIPPAVHDKLAASLVGEKGSRNAFALSRRLSGDNDTPALARRVVDALKELPVLTGSSSGSQPVDASRTDGPGDGGAGGNDETKEALAAMSHAAGIPVDDGK